jgi:hypothetical protein
MTVHAINKQPPPARSPERQALAEANEARAKAARATEAGRQAVERAIELVTAAETRLALANTDVGRSKERHTADVAAAVAAGHAMPASALRAARTVQADAQDDRDAAAAALERLQTRLAELEVEEGAVELGREAAINAVLAVRGFQFVKDLAARRSETLELLARLLFIHDRAGQRRGDIFSPIRELSEPLAALAPELDSALGTVTYTDLQAARTHLAVQRWEAAVAQLRMNPDAQLP